MQQLKSWKTWLFIIICVAFNLLGRDIAGTLNLPLWMDAMGTILVAITAGPISGAVCGLLTNSIIASKDIVALPYILVSITVAFASGLYYPKVKNKSNRTFHMASVAMATGFAAALISTPLNIIIYGGSTGNSWGDSLMEMLSNDVHVPILNSFIGEAFVDIPDKAFSFFIALGLIAFYKLITGKGKKLPLTFMILATISAALIPSFPSHAQNFAAEYAGDVYDTEFGLASVEITAIAQTSDGYIWAGTYSGIYRYDGYRFNAMNLDVRINNVMCLYVDSKNRLWIGTNDSGVVCYEPLTEEIRFYTVNEGLASNSIRSLTEDSEGNIFVATVNQLCSISPDSEITVFSEKSFYGIEKLSASKDVVAAIRGDGDVLIIKNNRMSYLIAGDYTAISTQNNGNFVLGTGSNQTALLRLGNGSVDIINKYHSDRINYYNDILYSKEFGGYFVACENGLGFMTDEGVFISMTADNFDSSIDDILIDYQGNIWFASSKQGIKRFTWNPFEDIFSRAKLDSEVVNSVIIKNGLLYVGTGSGLYTIDLKTYYSVPIPFPAYLKNVRIRDIMCDNDDNIWFSTYGEHGLIQLKSDHTIDYYNVRKAGTLGDRFRFAMQLSDGTIMASDNSGIDFIKNNEVIGTLGEVDGINAPVLCAIEDANHTVYAGSDGDGIYVIREGAVVDRIDENDGLGTMVVLKIIPCKGGYIYVTSNALYYSRDGFISKLKNFPYSNNYDVYLPGDGNAWVLSSAGIYVVSESALIQDEVYNYALLNKSRGLYSSVTADSSYTVKDDMLYLCCTDGVSRISVKNYSSFHNNFNILISNLYVDDQRIKEKDGIYNIPPTSGRILFDVAVLNYNLSNPLLHIYLEGAEDEGVTCYQNDMKELTFTNLPYGNYQLHVQVMDSSGSTIYREEIFHIHKESRLFERPYFKAYLAFIISLLVMYIGWAIGNIIQNANSLEKWQNAATQDPLTGLLNKRGSQEILEEACKNDKGILTILDLDSFKPINDIYGHSMGDRILVAVARLMQTCTREEDILCRVGGDEFIMFLKYAERDEVVADKTNYINVELLKTARTLIGKDMEIPLGISIGAVKAPAEGTDYAELLKKADKALYTVKNNGKHGYSIYSSSKNNSSISVAQEASGSLVSLRKILNERTTTDGAYRLDYDSLQDTYRLMRRMSKVSIIKAELAQFTVRSKSGGEIERDVMDRFYEIVKTSLLKSDMYTIDGKNKVFIIMPNINKPRENDNLADIMKKWEALPESENYEVFVEWEEL
ncbi:MAG: diguanylate cyclase [Butyrivibrio sp.]|nr:diguanylate cyclase [Butyrivibrio sp.]